MSGTSADRLALWLSKGDTPGYGPGTETWRHDLRAVLLAHRLMERALDDIVGDALRARGERSE